MYEKTRKFQPIPNWPVLHPHMLHPLTMARLVFCFVFMVTVYADGGGDESPGDTTRAETPEQNSDGVIVGEVPVVELGTEEFDAAMHGHIKDANGIPLSPRQRQQPWLIAFYIDKSPICTCCSNI